LRSRLSAGSAGHANPTILDGHKFDHDTILVMGVAFEMARASTKLFDRPDITQAAIASQIIALAQAGERNVDHLCDRALVILTATPPLSPPLVP
jgi:hypothetical protein